MWRQRIITLTVVLLSLLAAYGSARLEIIRRAAREIKEAREYLAHYQDPLARNRDLEAKLASGRITGEQYNFLIHEEILFAEDGLKGALVAYQTVIGSFNPPHSKYVDESLAGIFNCSGIFFQKDGFLLAKDGYETLVKYTETYGLPQGAGLTQNDIKLSRERIAICAAKLWPVKKKKS